MTGFVTAGTGSEGTLNEDAHSSVDHTGILGVGGGGGDAFPIGCIVPFGGGFPAIPGGWLACDGIEYGRTGGDPNPQPDLFGVIGTSWGIGDGSTTFNVPDLRARTLSMINDGTLVPAGQNFSFSSRSLAATSGAETHSHTVNSHNHSIGSDGNHSHTITISPDPGTFLETNLSASYPGNDGLNGRHTHNASSNSTGSHSHGGGTGNASPTTTGQSSLGPTAFCPFIIKAVAVGGGAGGISAQVNAGPLQGPQPTINLIEGNGISMTAVENPGQNRNDVTVNSTVAFATMSFGGALATPGDYAFVNGEAAGGVGAVAGLDFASQAVTPVGGGTVTLTWNALATGGTVRIFQNGGPVGTPVVLGTAAGLSVQALPVSPGDLFAVEYQVGTAPGRSNYHIHIAP